MNEIVPSATWGLHSMNYLLFCELHAAFRASIVIQFSAIVCGTRMQFEFFLLRRGALSFGPKMGSVFVSPKSAPVRTAYDDAILTVNI